MTRKSDLKEKPLTKTHQELFRMLRVILESGNKGIIDAISSDLREFAKAVKAQKEIEGLRQRLNSIEQDLMQSLEQEAPRAEEIKKILKKHFKKTPKN